MNTFIKNFLNDEDGAVTVDWVVLTAAIVGLGIAAITAVNGAVVGLGQDIEANLTAGGADNALIGAGIPAADAGGS
ncbi:Flp pilus assembly pilin Flp [Roseovarius sp. MBR-154]|jgi:Flp pilus assembly pilin Flp